MIKTYIRKDREYHLSSKNIKALFTGKTEHLRHYNPTIVNLEHDSGLKKFYNLPSISLPAPEELDMSLHRVMENRRSNRDYSDYKITLQEISTLAYYSCGYKMGEDSKRKHIPSSGGFNSTELFFIVLNSDEVMPGLYYFSPHDFCLKQIETGDFRDWVRNDAFYQNEWADASVICVLASDYARLSKKYGHRTYRLCLIDAGHAAQNIYLTCSAMKMKVCEVLGYVEHEVETALNIDDETPSFSTLIIGR